MKRQQPHILKTIVGERNRYNLVNFKYTVFSEDAG